MISITWIFFIIVCKYKDEGGMKKGLSRFAGLKFNVGSTFRFERKVQKVQEGVEHFQPLQKVGSNFQKLSNYFYKNFVSLCLRVFV